MTGKHQSITLPAVAASLGEVTEFVRQGALDANLPEHRVGELEIVIEEIVMNVSRYAYIDGSSGSLTITYIVPKPGELHVEVADQGREFDPLQAIPPDLTLHLIDRPIGGLGIFLLKSFAQPLAYRRENGWNRLTFGISANS